LRRSNLNEKLRTRPVRRCRRHLRTPEDMAAYLEACIERLMGDAVFIAKLRGRHCTCPGMTQGGRDFGAFQGAASTGPCLESAARAWTLFLKVGQRALGLKLSAGGESEVESDFWKLCIAVVGREMMPVVCRTFEHGALEWTDHLTNFFSITLKSCLPLMGHVRRIESRQKC